jgi:hypothetical protein
MGVSLPEGFSARVTGIPGGIEVHVGDEHGGSKATSLGESFQWQDIAAQIEFLAQQIQAKRIQAKREFF